jgi:hypothetical protein
MNNFILKASCIYTFLCVAIVGEKEEFFKNARRLDPVGFYLRLKFIKEFPNQPETQYFAAMNQKFISRVFDT